MKEIVLNADDNFLDGVNDFIDGILEENGCPPDVVLKINLCVEEVFVNIAHYAYKPEVGQAKIMCEVREDPRRAVIIFYDKGRHFNPLEREDPDINAGADERDIGGLGIFLVKKTMDRVEYSFEDGKNCLLLEKVF